MNFLPILTRGKIISLHRLQSLNILKSYLYDILHLNNVANFNYQSLFKILFGLFISIILSSNIAGQGNTVITYGQEEGLCGQNYTSSCFDAKGRLWIASFTGGVSRFDGAKWKCYFATDGLVSNSSYEIHGDKYGNVLINHNGFGITLIREDKIIPVDIPNVNPKFKDKYRMVMIKEEIFLYNLELKSIYKFDNKSQVFQQIKSNIFTNIDKLNFNLNGLTFGNDLDTALILEKTSLGISKLAMFCTKQEPYIINYEIKTPLPYYLLMSNNNGPVVFANNDLIMAINGELKSFRPAELLINNKKYPISAGKLMTVKSNANSNIVLAIWSLLVNKEYLITEYDSVTGKISKWYKYESIYRPQDIIKDFAGTYWVLNENNVQRILPYQLHIPLGSTNLQPQTWTAIQAKDGNIWFASYRNGLSYFDGLHTFLPSPDLANNYSFSDGSYADKEGNMYFDLEGNSEKNYTGGGIVKFDGARKLSIINEGILGLFFNEGKRGELLWGTAERGLWIKQPNGKMEDIKSWDKIDSSKGMYLTNVLTALEDRHGRYWMGRSSQGISVYDKSTRKAFNFFKEKNKRMFGTMSMAEDKEGNLWFGTPRGLYFYKNNKVIDEFFDILNNSELIGSDVLGNSLVNVCKIYDAHTLIIGNMTGYFLLNLDAFYQNPRKISFKGAFRKNNTNYAGGQVNQNSAFIDRDSMIWLPTSNGVFRHDPRVYVEDTTNIAVRVDSIKVGKIVINSKNFGECIELGPTEKTLTFYFNFVANRFLYDNIWYRFRLNENEWSELTKLNNISFQNLDNGAFTFQVQAIKNGNFSEIVSVKFRIDSPLWLKWWFWLLIFGSVMAIVVFLFMKQNEIKDHQIQIALNRAQVDRINKEKSKLQIEAITNQLNPHFINNALQWLQVRIDEDEEAVKVVDKLSENINTVFRNSRNKINFHSLLEELKLTENYLFIQKARFGDRLQIKMPSKEQIFYLGNYNVPLMIIQIHTENAIEHGIRNKKDGKGTVRISIQEIDNFIQISIEDDGVGRVKAQSIGSKGTQNGTKMLNELQLIYNEFNYFKMTQNYEDEIFSDQAGVKFGTRMNITIPKSFNFQV